MTKTTPQTAIKQLRLFISPSTFRKLPKKALIDAMISVTRGDNPETVARSLTSSSAVWINSDENI